MSKIKEIDTKQIMAGQGTGFWLCLSAGIVFLIGLVDGIVRPYKCN